jgi:hypothetical protein
MFAMCPLPFFTLKADRTNKLDNSACYIDDIAIVSRVSAMLHAIIVLEKEDSVALR